MKNIFFVTSAIFTKHGQFSHDERYKQTKETLRTIKFKDPTAYVIFCDASMDRSLSQEESDDILKFTDVIINLSNSIELRQVYETTQNHDIIKNYSEMLMSLKVYNFIATNNDLKEYDRIFKISGRYVLTPNFDINEFAKHPNAIIFATRRRSQFDPAITGGLTEQFMSRLYSFPMSKITLVKDKFSVMLATFVNNLQKNIYTDMEHSMFREFSDEQDLLEVPRINVAGLLGPNKMSVED